jgi:tetratricopeptide (TPR) repeat protein
MTDRTIRWLIGATVLALLGAASLADVEDLVRQGNAAFARGDYAKAAAHYEEAEARSTDPGLVAFNKATALFEDGQYDEAAKHYWLCLGDAGAEAERLLRREPGAALPDRVCKAAGPRLAKVLYDLGNCELQRSKGTDGEALAWAAILYGECLRAKPVDSSLRDDARHNLEVARDLLVLHPPKPASRDTSKDENPEESPPKKPDDRSGAERSGRTGAIPRRNRGMAM